MAQSSPQRPNRAGLGGSTAFRGSILVVVALAVGILLMVKGGGGTVAAGPGDQLVATTTTSSIPAGAGPSSTVATTALPPSAVKVIVANGSSVKGLAAKTKTTLAGAGYTNVTATDTTAGAKVTSSLVYFAAGADADAKAVARAAGFSTDRVAPLPAGQVPVSPIGDARVIVLLGPDAPGAGTATTLAAQATTTTVKK